MILRAFAQTSCFVFLVACQTTTNSTMSASRPQIGPEPMTMTCKQLLAERQLLKEEAQMFGGSPYGGRVSSQNSGFRTANVAQSYAQGYAIGAQARQDKRAAALQERYSKVSRAIIEKGCL